MACSSASAAASGEEEKKEQKLIDAQAAQAPAVR